MAKRIFKKKVVLKRKRAAKSKKTFAKKVMAIVTKKAETKTISFQNNGIVMAPSGGGALTQINLMAPFLSLSQGSGQGDRIGNSVTIKKATLRYFLMPYEYNAAWNPNPYPSEVQVIIGKNKQYPQTSLPTSIMFNVGNGSAAPGNTLMDLMTPLNKDAIVLGSRKTHKVGFASTVTAGGAQTFNEHLANNDFKLSQRRTVDITKWCPAKVLYNDTTSTPLSPYLYALFQPVNAMGGTPTNAGAAVLSYVVDFEYTDL